MAEDDEHRRIEARPGVAGTGMLSDPERIQSIENEYARRERAWREPPKKRFGAVLTDTPAKEAERVGVYVPSPDDPRRRPKATEAAEDAAESEGDTDDGAADDVDARDADAPAAIEGLDAAPPKPALPRVPPDPRMAALNAALDGKKRR